MMKYAYAQVLTGSVGPFSFELPTGYAHNYQLKRQSGGLMITIPGGQVVGYLLKMIPKFPFNQTVPPQPGQCEETPTGAPHRMRRSNDGPAPIKNMKQIAFSLFSERPYFHTDKNELGDISAGYIESIIKDGELNVERVSRFVDSI